MIKKIAAITVAIFCLSACQKDNMPAPIQNNEIKQDAKTPTIEEAKLWLDSIRIVATKRTASSGSNLTESTQIDWGKAKSLNLNSGTYLQVPLQGAMTFQNITQGYRKLLLFKNKSGRTDGYILEIIPDAITYQKLGTIDPRTFTGRVFVYNAQYQLLEGYIFIKGKRAGTIKPSINIGESRLRINSAAFTDSCIWVDKNYVNANNEVIIYSEKVCPIDPVDLSYDMPSNQPPLGSEPPAYAGGGGSGSGSGASAPSVSNLPGEQNPKINPKNYTKCFGDIPDAGATLKVTVYVAEPNLFSGMNASYCLIKRQKSN